MSDNISNSNRKSSNLKSGFPAADAVLNRQHNSNLNDSDSATDPIPNPNPTSNFVAKIFASGTIPAGTLLGHFMVQNYIGGGGMGRVYLATDTSLDRKVAIKVLPYQRVNDQSTVARFMNEAKSAARLNHEHIAQVYFAGEQDGMPFIVFEYVEGTNIRKMINDSGVFPLPQTLNYMLQISHALAHAAENGVVHRDVKPSNILITREGKAKLIDMGLARLLNPSDGGGDLTASGVTLGTFDYISPEQARDPRNADIRSDIYSLGCTFFFMLAGRPPFPEGTVLQKLLQHQGDLPPDIREIQPNIPAEVAILIQKMMAKDPRQRFQSPDVLISALALIARKIGMQPVGHGHISWTMQPTKKPPFFIKHAIWASTFEILFIIFIMMNIFGNKYKQLELPAFPEPAQPVAIQNANNNNSTTQTANDSAEAATKKLLRQLAANDTANFDRQIQSRFPILETIFLGNQNSNKSDDFSLRIFEKTQFGTRLAPTPINAVVLPQTQIAASIKTKNNSTKQLPTDSASSNNSSSSKFIRRSLIRVDPTFDDRFDPAYPAIDPNDTYSIRTYANFKSAIESAEANSIIELRWNDFLLVEPFSLNERNIRFVAAEGYRPTILFEPAKTTKNSTGIRSMITVNSCEIEFADVSIEMRISQDVLASRWTLFDIIGTNKFDFSHATITIANATSNFSPYHQDVAFFRSSQLPQRIGIIQFTPEWNRFFNETNDMWKLENPMMERFIPGRTTNNEQIGAIKPPELSNQINIKMNNSMIRGEATVLQNEVATGVDFIAGQSIIATAKPFIQIEDNKRANQIKPVRIAFDRVTYASRQSFARLITNNNPEPTRIDCEIQLSLFILNNAPLFEFSGNATHEKINSAFRWNGTQNDFQNVALAWQTKQANTTSEVNYNYSEYNLTDWIKKFDKESGINRLFLQEFKKPMYQLQSRDFIQKTTQEKTRPAAGWIKNE
jgi:serine/threonine protein kinase